jgi:hypothetical protein
MMMSLKKLVHFVKLKRVGKEYPVVDLLASLIADLKMNSGRVLYLLLCILRLGKSN